MRLFIYGMQSSGASLATYLLGQVRDAVVLVDLYSYAVMPAIDAPQAEHVIGKAVVTTTHSFEDHVRSFRPDKSILLLRDPVQNYVALSRKAYANDDGTLEAKFRRLNEVFRGRSAFDVVLRYEDIVAAPARVVTMLQQIGFPASVDLYAFPRSREEITEYNVRHCEWCRDRFGRGWSFGNIHGDRMQQTLVHKHAPRNVQATVAALCPDVVKYYQSTGSDRSFARAAGVLRDVIGRPIGERTIAAARAARRLAGSMMRSVTGVRS
jgi:hypothetical protein